MESNSSGPPSDDNDTAWFEEDFSGYPVIYPITTTYLLPIIQCGRMVHVFWYIIGFAGNTVSLKIWTIPRMSRLNTAALYLVAIAACDIVYQVLHVFNYLKYFWGKASLGSSPLCELWNILNMIPQYGSQILVFGFTAERFLSICRPFHSDRFSKNHRIPKEVACIMVLSVAFALPQGYFWSIDNRGFCELRNDQSVIQSYLIWSLVTETVIFLVLPIATLTLNLFVIYYTRQALRKKYCGGAPDENSCESRIHRKDNRYRPATMTLLCISFFRIFTQLPVSITYSIQTMTEFDFGQMMPISAMYADAQWRKFLKYWGARIVIEMIGSSHHALCFFIFYASTKQFRWELRQLASSLKQNVSSKRSSDEIRFGYFNTPSNQTDLKCIKFNPD